MNSAVAIGGPHDQTTISWKGDRYLFPTYAGYDKRQIRLRTYLLRRFEVAPGTVRAFWVYEAMPDATALRQILTHLQTS